MTKIEEGFAFGVRKDRFVAKDYSDELTTCGAILAIVALFEVLIFGVFSSSDNSLRLLFSLFIVLAWPLFVLSLPRLMWGLGVPSWGKVYVWAKRVTMLLLIAQATLFFVLSI